MIPNPLPYPQNTKLPNKIHNLTVPRNSESQSLPVSRAPKRFVQSPGETHAPNPCTPFTTRHNSSSRIFPRPFPFPFPFPPPLPSPFPALRPELVPFPFFPDPVALAFAPPPLPRASAVDAFSFFLLSLLVVLSPIVPAPRSETPSPCLSFLFFPLSILIFHPSSFIDLSVRPSVGCCIVSQQKRPDRFELIPCRVIQRCGVREERVLKGEVEALYGSPFVLCLSAMRSWER